MVNNFPADTGDVSLIRGSERSPGEGNDNPFQYSCLGNPMDRGASQAAVHEVAKSRTRLSMHSTQLSIFIPQGLFWDYYQLCDK